MHSGRLLVAVPLLPGGLRIIIRPLLLAVLTPVAALAQGTEELIAPVGTRTVVGFSAPANSKLAVQTGSFHGSAEVLSDPAMAHYTLMIVSRSAGPRLGDYCTEAGQHA